MKDNVKPTFNKQDIGYISHGPTRRLVATVVDYMDMTSHFRFYCDLRMGVVSKNDNKEFFATQRGVTMPLNVLMGINNALIKIIGEPAPELAPDESKLIARVNKNKHGDICLSIVNYDNGPKIDIREWKISSEYTGFTAKGIRAEYTTAKEFSALLMHSVNKMVDMEKKMIGDSLGKRTKPIEEDVPF